MTVRDGKKLYDFQPYLIHLITVSSWFLEITLKSISNVSCFSVVSIGSRKAMALLSPVWSSGFGNLIP